MDVFVLLCLYLLAILVLIGLRRFYDRLSKQLKQAQGDKQVIYQQIGAMIDTDEHLIFRERIVAVSKESIELTKRCDQVNMLNIYFIFGQLAADVAELRKKVELLCNVVHNHYGAALKQN